MFDAHFSSTHRVTRHPMGSCSRHLLTEHDMQLQQLKRTLVGQGEHISSGERGFL